MPFERSAACWPFAVGDGNEPEPMPADIARRWNRYRYRFSAERN